MDGPGGRGDRRAGDGHRLQRLHQVPAERQGEAGGALQLAQTFATAVIAGLGGAAIAFGDDRDSSMLGGMLLADRLRADPA
ncbi:hypothetical protein [Actinomadura litoris]|uniref:hypothetical protein n=1 Tax=Actinomadura litoris TaxID=2678616 RepID=UPI001FA6F74B|nr:hypothetical protein [Actinomadura litoris]